MCGQKYQFYDTSHRVGVRYGWQVSRGSGFINLTDWVIYQESGSANLSIISAGSSFNSYQYRCIVNGTESCTMVPDTSQVANLLGSIAAQSHQVLMDTPILY